jgi:GTP-binding protein EngB required for normal cell division
MVDAAVHAVQAKVFVGNTGAGKSTLLNGMGAAVAFPSGVSIATGKTTALEKAVTLDGVLLVDTPGLTDQKTREIAADEIGRAFQDGGRFNLFFVITLEAGRLRPADIVIMELVLEATKVKENQYTIIVNKVSEKILKKEPDLGSKLKGFLWKVCKLPPTDYLYIYPLDRSWEDRDYVEVQPDEYPYAEFLDFVEMCPTVNILKADPLRITEWERLLLKAAKIIDASWK